MKKAPRISRFICIFFSTILLALICVNNSHAEDSPNYPFFSYAFESNLLDVSELDIRFDNNRIYWFSLSPSGRYILGVDHLSNTDTHTANMYLYDTVWEQCTTLSLDFSNDRYGNLQRLLSMKNENIYAEIDVIWSKDEFYFTFYTSQTLRDRLALTSSDLIIGSTVYHSLRVLESWEPLSREHHAYVHVYQACFDNSDSSILYYSLVSYSSSSNAFAYFSREYDLKTNTSSDLFSNIWTETDGITYLSSSKHLYQNSNGELLQLVKDKECSRLYIRVSSEQNNEWTNVLHPLLTPETADLFPPLHPYTSAIKHTDNHNSLIPNNLLFNLLDDGTCSLYIFDELYLMDIDKSNCHIKHTITFGINKPLQFSSNGQYYILPSSTTQSKDQYDTTYDDADWRSQHTTTYQLNICNTLSSETRPLNVTWMIDEYSFNCDAHVEWSGDYLLAFLPDGSHLYRLTSTKPDEYPMPFGLVGTSWCYEEYEFFPAGIRLQLKDNGDFELTVYILDKEIAICGKYTMTNNQASLVPHVETAEYFIGYDDDGYPLTLSYDSGDFDFEYLDQDQITMNDGLNTLEFEDFIYPYQTPVPRITPAPTAAPTPIPLAKEYLVGSWGNGRLKLAENGSASFDGYDGNYRIQDGKIIFSAYDEGLDDMITEIFIWNGDNTLSLNPWTLKKD